MIREIGGEHVYVAIVSAGRPGNVERMRTYTEATWHVPAEQEGAYALAGASTRGPGCATSVAVARNHCLEAAFARRVPCVMLDDDLRGKILLANIETWTPAATEISVDQAIVLMLDRLEEYQLRLAGGGQTRNLSWIKSAVTTTRLISGGMTCVLPTDLRYDEKQPVYDDLDYSIQHIVEYGGALRCNDLVLDFRMFQDGGIQAYRTIDESGKQARRDDPASLAASARLVERWGNLIQFKNGDPVRPYINPPRSAKL